MPKLIPITMPIATMVGFTSGRIPKPDVKIQSNNLVISNVNSGDITIRREAIHIQNFEKCIRSIIEDPLFTNSVKLDMLTKIASSFHAN